MQAVILVSFFLAAEAGLPCGPASLNAFFRAVGRPVPWEQIVAACQEASHRDDVTYMSVAELVAAARTLGLSLTPIRIEPPDHELLPTPAILYLEPTGRAGPHPMLGHFAVLVDKGPHHVGILDITLSDQVQDVPLAVLYAHWSGVALVRHRAVAWKKGLVPFMIGLVAGTAVFFLTRLGITTVLRRSTLPLAILAIIGSGPGCSRTPAPLRVEPQRVDLGTVREERAVVRVTLQAWRRGPVTLRDLSTECAGLRYRPEMKGTVLKPGERRTVELTVSGDGTGRPQAFFWEVLTDPPAAVSPSVLITGRFFPRPVVHPNPVFLRVPVHEPANATVTVVVLRPASEPPLAVRPIPLSNTTIRLTPGRRISQIHYREAKGRPVTVRDIQTLQVQVPSTLAVGQHHATFRLELGDRWKPLMLSVQVTVSQPLVFEQTRLFAGVLQVGKPWEYELRYDELVAGTADRVRLVPTERWIHAQLDAARRVVRVRLTAPARGRFAGAVRVEFGQNIPPLRIEVSGIGIDPKSSPKHAVSGR